MNCRDFREVADSYLSDELLTETNHDMIRHMEACGDCRAVIEARREIRTRLRNAVIEAPEYLIDEHFNHNLMTRLRYENDNTGKSYGFGLRSLLLAASVLVVGFLGFGLFTNLNSTVDGRYLVSGFSADSLINIAAGDHQYCAVDHNLDEAPVALRDGDPAYVGLEQVVATGVPSALSDHKLVEAHSCRYKNVRFAHFVLKGKNDTLSVLVTPLKSVNRSKAPELRSNSSENFQVASFEASDNAVFVLSDLSAEANKKAAEALSEPMSNYFQGTTNVNTARLKFRGIQPL